MIRLISGLRNFGLRQIFSVFLVAITFLVIPAFSYSVSLQAQADTLIAQADPSVDKATIKRIQDKAEDLGDSPERPIGKTGLKNIKKLGENIPETIELRARQGILSGDPDNLDKDNLYDKAKEGINNALNK